MAVCVRARARAVLYSQRGFLLSPSRDREILGRPIPLRTSFDVRNRAPTVHYRFSRFHGPFRSCIVDERKTIVDRFNNNIIRIGN